MDDEEDEPLPPRIHGFQPPLDPLQFVAAFAYALFTTALVVIHGPLIGPGLFQLLVVVALLVWLGLSVSSYIVAALAPAHDDGANSVATADELDYPAEGKKACFYCVSLVSPETKHCWDCNKCVYRFDHHCRWLNNCVGEKNYTKFAVFLGNTLALMSIQTGVALFLFLEFFIDASSFEQRASRAFGRRSEHEVHGLVAVLFIIFFLELLSLLLLLHLQGLHVYLFFRRITTYQWILQKRDRLRAERKERRELGMDPRTPVCHELAVWRFKRQHQLSSSEVIAPAQTKYKETELPRRTYRNAEASVADDFEGDYDEGDLSVNDGLDQCATAAPPDDLAPSPKLDFSTDEDRRSRSSTPRCSADAPPGS